MQSPTISARVKSTLEKPQFFRLRKNSDSRKFRSLLKKHRQLTIVDDFTHQLRELFAIEHPELALQQNFEAHFQTFFAKINKWSAREGVWVYFPWLQTVVHILDEKNFFTVRTARNKMLITEKEQRQFYDAVVGIGGLSIGNSVALTLVLQGGCKHLRLADFDTLTLSNTNRIRSGVQYLGLPKTVLTARQIYELNPFAKLEIFQEGITEQNAERFVKGLDVLVDEMDSLHTKFLLRHTAKKYKVPVVMGADNANEAIVDIERYDGKKQVRYFHGRLRGINENKLKNLTKFEIGKTIAKLIGLENHTDRMLLSLQEMGKTIVSWPQLGGTAALNGTAVAYCVKQIVTKQPLNSGRGILSLDEKFQGDYGSKPQKIKQKKAQAKFKKLFSL